MSSGVSSVGTGRWSRSGRTLSVLIPALLMSTSSFANSAADLRDERIDVGLAGHVQPDRAHVAFDPLGSRSPCLEIACAKQHGHTQGSKALGDREADAFAGSGDDRDLVWIKG